MEKKFLTLGLVVILFSFFYARIQKNHSVQADLDIYVHSSRSKNSDSLLDERLRALNEDMGKKILIAFGSMLILLTCMPFIFLLLKNKIFFAQLALEFFIVERSLFSKLRVGEVKQVMDSLQAFLSTRSVFFDANQDEHWQAYMQFLKTPSQEKILHYVKKIGVTFRTEKETADKYTRGKGTNALFWLAAKKVSEHCIPVPEESGLHHPFKSVVKAAESYITPPRRL